MNHVSLVKILAAVAGVDVSGTAAAVAPAMSPSIGLHRGAG